MANTQKNKTTSKSTEKSTVEKSTVDTTANEVVKEIPLQDSDEIECTAQIPNLSYEDKKTGDYYKWDNISDVEYIRFDVLKDMFRNANAYLRNMLFTVNDERVIKHFRLEKLYANYSKLIIADTYTMGNVKEIKEILKELPKGVLGTIITKVKAMVVDGQITNIKVIRELEKMFDIDLVYLLDL